MSSEYTSKTESNNLLVRCYCACTACVHNYVGGARNKRARGRAHEIITSQCK